jgi:hypothetical protein
MSLVPAHAETPSTSKATCGKKPERERLSIETS